MRNFSATKMAAALSSPSSRALAVQRAGAERLFSRALHDLLLLPDGVGGWRELTPVQAWRLRDRLKTVAAALVLCLNVGVDPPDVIKPDPCARLECWLDPASMPAQKALEAIGKALQAQYECWQPRASYRLCADPTLEELRKVCVGLRRNHGGREERLLLHFNGHGVPRPSVNGELWVFNRSFTQYIPVSAYDLQLWLGSPCILVLDCSNAARVIEALDTMMAAPAAGGAAAGGASGASPAAGAGAGDGDAARGVTGAGGGSGAGAAGSGGAFGAGGAHGGAFGAGGGGTAGAKGAAVGAAGAPNAPGEGGAVLGEDVIVLGACDSTAQLPTNPELPADVFTCCLTTPLRMALRFACRNTLLYLPSGPIDTLPGALGDRRSPLGELNWIFTAITDSIAWDVLPRELFRRLFRQDLLLASLLRNFLLAQRILSRAGLYPVSAPALPPMHHHPLWESFDLVIEAAICDANARRGREAPPPPSPFFSDQLTAFEVWLRLGSRGSRRPPEQLPILLQVLLSPL